MAAGRPRGKLAAFKQGDTETAERQVVGNAGSGGPAADDDDVRTLRSCCHALPPADTPLSRKSLTSTAFKLRRRPSPVKGPRSPRGGPEDPISGIPRSPHRRVPSGACPQGDGVVVRDRLLSGKGGGRHHGPPRRGRGEPLSSHKEFGEMAAVCMMDAGNNGVLILADHMLPPRKAGVMIPGPQVHAMKVAFEKYYLWKSRHGYVRLP